MTRAEALAWGLGDRRRLTTNEIPTEVLSLVDERQGGRACVFCREQGLTTPPDVPLEIDHRQPLSKEGDNHHLNLQWSCRSHNRGRAARHDAPATPRWARRCAP